MQNRAPLTPDHRPLLPDFTPVSRKYRYDGWTPERQRAFIAALAETGSVKAAAHRINMSPEGAYYLRRQPGADEFRAAWSAALDFGVQSLADIAIERARDGVPVPVFYRGEQVGERRWYNDRLLMFILKHHMPNKYGANLPAGTKHPDTIAREHAEEIAAEDARSDEITRRLQRFRQGLLREVAASPERRAAWDVLCGPTDWARVEGAAWGEDDGFADCNLASRSTILLFAALDGAPAAEEQEEDPDER